MLANSSAGFAMGPPAIGLSARRLTGGKRSAFGRLSGRQRPEADEVGGDAKRLRPGNGRSHNKPPSGDSLREFVLHSLNPKGARPAYETFPCGERRLPLDVRRQAEISGLLDSSRTARPYSTLTHTETATFRAQTSRLAPPPPIALGLDSASLSILAHGRRPAPCSTQLRRPDSTAWARLDNLASSTPRAQPSLLSGLGRPDSHPPAGSGRWAGQDRQLGERFALWLAQPTVPLRDVASLGCRGGLPAQPGRA